MAVMIRKGKGGNAPTSSQRKLVDDEQVVQEDETPNNVVQANDEVRIDIDDNVDETQEEVNPSMDHLIGILEPVVQKAKAPLPKPPPQSLFKKNSEHQFKKFIDMMKSLSINVPLVESFDQINAIVHSMAPKLEYPGAFTIPCTIASAEFTKALCDLGASINLMPYSVFKTLGIEQPRPTSMRLKTTDRTMKRPLEIIEDVLVRVDKFILQANFIFLDCEVDYEVPIILRRPFFVVGKVLVDVEVGELTFRAGDEKVVFHTCKSMRQPNSNKVCSFTDLVTDVIVDETSALMNVDDILEVILLNFGDDEMDGFVEYVNSLQGMGSCTYGPHKLSLDLENRTTPCTKPSIEEPPIFELKPLPPQLTYEFLGPSNTLPVILSSCLTNVQVDSIKAVLQKRKKDIGWTLVDKHRILHAQD
ncbi:uncharacterized protein [Nicotiana sylvestris]|uniref:uncharacterized protein n=1 Tax=Nicotiana sylvestris TaxID=4096 RepID=UPI00388CCB25